MVLHKIQVDASNCVVLIMPRIVWNLLDTTHCHHQRRRRKDGPSLPWSTSQRGGGCGEGNDRFTIVITEADSGALLRLQGWGRRVKGSERSDLLGPCYRSFLLSFICCGAGAFAGSDSGDGGRGGAAAAAGRGCEIKSSVVLAAVRTASPARSPWDITGRCCVVACRGGNLGAIWREERNSQFFSPWHIQSIHISNIHLEEKSL